MRDQVATKIGVDIVVGLQSVAKPLMKKLEAGKVGKHSIIKALNKVYKRPAYFPPLEKPLDADTQLLSDDAAFEETLLADTVEVEQEPVSPNANSGKPSLDFSQSFEMPKK